MARVLKTIDKTFDLLRKTLEWRLRDYAFIAKNGEVVKMRHCYGKS